MTPNIEVVDLDALLQDPVNANRGTADGHELLQRNIGSLGLARGIVADRHNVIIGGNQIHKAAAAHEQATGRKVKVVMVDTDGDTLVVNRRTDMDMASVEDNRARAAAIADNTVSRVTQDLDYDVIGEQVAEFSLPVDLLAIDDLPVIDGGDELSQPSESEDRETSSMPLRDPGAEAAAVDADKAVATSAEDPKPLGDVAQQFKSRWAILVEFADEQEEKHWYEKFINAGLACKMQNINFGG